MTRPQPGTLRATDRLADDGTVTVTVASTSDSPPAGDHWQCEPIPVASGTLALAGPVRGTSEAALPDVTVALRL